VAHAPRVHVGQSVPFLVNFLPPSFPQSHTRSDGSLEEVRRSSIGRSAVGNYGFGESSQGWPPADNYTSSFYVDGSRPLAFRSNLVGRRKGIPGRVLVGAVGPSRQSSSVTFRTQLRSPPKHHLTREGVA